MSCGDGDAVGRRDEHAVPADADLRGAQLGQLAGRHALREGEADLGRRRVAAAELARRPGGDDLAAHHHGDAVGERLRLVHEVRRQHDGLAEVAQRADRRPRLAAGVGVEAGGRLVEEQQVGVAHEREREVEAAPLPARQRGDEVVAARVELHELDHLVDPPWPRVPAGVHLEHLADGEVLLQARVLQHDPHALAHRALAVGGVVAEHRDLAGVAQPVALEDLDGGRLAGAVGAEEAEHLAGGDVEADAAHRLDAVVGLAQVAHSDSVHARHARSAPGSPPVARLLTSA